MTQTGGHDVKPMPCGAGLTWDNIDYSDTFKKWGKCLNKNYYSLDLSSYKDSEDITCFVYFNKNTEFEYRVLYDAIAQLLRNNVTFMISLEKFNENFEVKKEYER